MKRGRRQLLPGGITRVATMPNTKPGHRSAIIVDGMKYKIEREAKVKVEIIGAISKGLQGQELAAMGHHGQRRRRRFLDDGRYVKNCDFMRKAMEYASMFHKVIIDHCEEQSLVEGGSMHEGVVSTDWASKAVRLSPKTLPSPAIFSWPKRHTRRSTSLTSAPRTLSNWSRSQKRVSHGESHAAAPHPDR